MKKLLIFLGVVFMATIAMAQPHNGGLSFIEARSIQVTNTMSITNLTALGVVQTTNVAGVVFTNLAGTRVLVAGGNYENYNLLKTVPVTPTLDVPVAYALSSGSDTNETAQAGPYAGNIYIRVIGGSGANTATSFVFAPVPNLARGVQSTAAGDLITVSVTPNTTTQVTSITKVDRQKLIGCEGLRLVSVTAGDTDANSQVVVLECTYNAFRP